MRVRSIVVQIGFLVVVMIWCFQMMAQEPGCREIAKMSALAKAKSLPALQLLKQKAGDSYQAQLIFAARELEINSHDKNSASRFLELLPKEDSDPRQTFWLDLPQLSQCKSGGISDSDLDPLFVLQYHFPHLAAKATLLDPDKMFEYISYAMIATWPDSDYAVQMRRVCRVKHKEFIQAFEKLDTGDKEFFISKIFNPQSCRTIFFPEQ